MRFQRSITVVGCHAEGEVGDVIIGGVLDAPPTCETMYDKLVYFQQEQDRIRQLVLNEPRGRASMNTNLLLPPCNPQAAAGFLIMESEEYAPMSGSNTICTATVLLEQGIIPMVEPKTKFYLDTAAGLVGITADCEDGKCKAVAFDNVASFVFALDKPINVPGLGVIKVDVAWGGMIYALVDVNTCGLEVDNRYGPQLVEVGERIKRAVQEQYVPVHPENASIRGVTNFCWMSRLENHGTHKESTNAVVVSPGRFDRSPCGTGTSARMAVLYARGELDAGEEFRHKSIIGTKFDCHIHSTTTVGPYPAVLTTIKGRAWITSFKQIVLDPSDPFPVGFRVGDQWHTPGHVN